MTYPQCKLTISGQHMFMDMYPKAMFDHSKEYQEAQAWRRRSIDPQKCIACGIIDDLRFIGEGGK